MKSFHHQDLVVREINITNNIYLDNIDRLSEILYWVRKKCGYTW